MNETEAVLSEILAAAERIGCAPSTLCLRAVNNSRIPEMLANNKTVTLKTLTRLRAYIAQVPSKTNNKEQVA